MWRKLLFTALVCAAHAQFQVPEADIQILQPKGFTVSIPHEEGIKLFAFHAKINEEMNGREGGTYSRDIVVPKNGRWTFVDKNTKFKVGDIIYYWTYVDYNDGERTLGYTRDDQQFVVRGFASNTTQDKCPASKTIVSDGRQLCAGHIIFEEDFQSPQVDEAKWTIEQYIPMNFEPNYEFVSYQNNANNRFTKDGNIYLKPIVANDENDLRNTLDLTSGCTHSNLSACTFKSVGAYLLPPVASGKITSKLSFTYGKVEIRAKLPVGDWIYPQIELVQNVHAYPRIFIAYARGNERLTLRDGSDIGAKMLFGGVAVQPDEPARSTNLRSYSSGSPITSAFHTFSLTWDPDKIDLSVDGQNYGRIPTSRFSAYSGVQITLGVGVGGYYDFPDDSLSGAFKKPWKNKKLLQVKPFFNEKAAWHNTWHGDDVALIVDYVKVWAI